MSKIYISGAIVGLPFEKVKKKFDKTESELNARGCEAVSPLKTRIHYNAPWKIHAAINIVLLIGCDAVYLLPDWKYSQVATLEKNIAELLGKEIIYEEVQIFAELKKAIYEVMEISFSDITGRSRKRHIVFARMIYSHFCSMKGETITSIAAEIKRNHSTIIYYLRKFDDDYRFNPKFREIANRIESALSKTDF